MSSGNRVGLLRAVVTSAVATAVALGLQQLVRSTWQVRSLPERVMEWLLLFVPLDLFERGLQQLGPSAKEAALTGTTIGMALLLFAIGVGVLLAGWRGWRLLALGVALWLLAMVVVFPVTGGGVFGSDLPQTPALVNAGVLLIFLGYASVLVVGQLVRVTRREPNPVKTVLSPESRRTALAGLVGLVGTALAYSVASVAGRNGGVAASSLPLAVPPTRVAPTPEPASAGTATPSAAAMEQMMATPEPLPIPPERPLARNKDGVLTAAGRPPGTLSPPITTNDDFYVVTKNAVADPVVDPHAWRLVIDGQVARPVQVDYVTLRQLPAVEVTKTLECISNLTAMCQLASFGCDLMSTARWKGVRLRDLIDLAGGLTGDVQGFAILAADEFSAGLPVDAAMDPQTLVVYEMNGEVLPREHGYPARLLVPGRYGMKNPKWLSGIRPMAREYQGWYEQRGWNKDAIVKTMARIDLPQDGAALAPGSQRVAGVAYAGSRGVQLVELSSDGGDTWQPTRFLEPPPAPDTMVRWEGAFDLPPGATVSLVVRATDGTGAVQPDDFQLPQPDGGSGRHAVQVHAAT